MVGKLVLLKLARYNYRKKKQSDAENSHASVLKRISATKHSSKPGKACAKICRICLNPGEIPIYDNDMHEDLPTYITSFGGINVSPEDTYPRHICEQCNSLLQGAIFFRNTAQQSDVILKKSEQKYKLTDHNVLSKLNDDFSNSDDNSSKYLESSVHIKNEPGNLAFAEEILQNPFHCKKCVLEFETKDELMQHKTSDDHKKATCSICNQQYSKTYLKRHMYIHSAETFNEGFSLRSKSSENPKSIAETVSICDICGKKFASKGQLNRHRLTHFLDLPYKCHLCPYKGRFTESLKMHMRSHSGEKPYKCPECEDRTFINKSNLNKHMLVHKKDFDYKCDKCNKGFHTRKMLEIHVKVHHLGIKDYDCNICSKLFGSRRHLMKHKLKVHKREKLRSGRTPLYILAENQEGKSNESSITPT